MPKNTAWYRVPSDAKCAYILITWPLLAASPNPHALYPSSYLHKACRARPNRFTTRICLGAAPRKIKQVCSLLYIYIHMYCRIICSHHYDDDQQPSAVCVANGRGDQGRAFSDGWSAEQRQPRARSKMISAITRLGRWAVFGRTMVGWGVIVCSNVISIMLYVYHRAKQGCLLYSGASVLREFRKRYCTLYIPPSLLSLMTVVVGFCAELWCARGARSRFNASAAPVTMCILPPPGYSPHPLADLIRTRLFWIPSNISAPFVYQVHTHTHRRFFYQCPVYRWLWYLWRAFALCLGLLITGDLLLSWPGQWPNGPPST